MYLILRDDLAYKYIQGAHALAAFALYHPAKFTNWNNQHLICLSVFNGIALNHLTEELFQFAYEKKYKIDQATFVEPDLESELPTAMCIFNDGTLDPILNKLKLATK